ncbi:MAG: acyl-CoA thioesterase [Bacteroidales bacterium]|nr:acyl-CoA thioesterase [Bacteroidales bacterium]MCD8394272.1 acyl-CoA thioesterase [Bacteroidales bacterium]
MQDKKPVQFAEQQGSRVPPCTVPFYHVVDLQTRFNDIDMLGHLNNNVYLEFMDLGKTRYMTDVMGPVDWMRFTAVVVHIDCDYFAPAFLGEPLAVATTVTGVSKHSFRLEQRIFDTKTGQVKCIGRTVMAGFDPVTGGSAEISPAWIIEFSRYEGRNL